MGFYRVAEVVEGAVPSCMYLLGAMGTALLAVVGALVKVASMLLSEKMARITDKEAIIEKLEEAREARDTLRRRREES
jgi:hypothetical protein